MWNNYAENVYQNLIPDSFLIFVNNPKQPLHCKKKKNLKKLTSFFLSNPVPFDGQNYQKQMGPGASDQLLFRLQNKFRKIALLVMHYLTKFYDVI